MLSKRWERIIETISSVKLESVNTERVKQLLTYDMEVDAQVLDNLYILGVLTLDEYKEKMSWYIENLKGRAKCAEEQLKNANEKGDKYNPMIFYGFGNTYMGAGIADKSHENFTEWLKSK